MREAPGCYALSPVARHRRYRSPDRFGARTHRDRSSWQKEESCWETEIGSVAEGEASWDEIVRGFRQQLEESD